ncbi:hypothetical protein T01_1148, partial [Trichinella spiralis]
LKISYLYFVFLSCLLHELYAQLMVYSENGK